MTRPRASGRPASGVPASGRPSRGYRWPTATPGNELALKHGAWSPRKVEPLAADYAGRVQADAAVPGSPIAYLAEPSYAFALHAWARTEARIQLVSEWLLEHGGDLDPTGDVRAAATLLNQLEKRAEAHRTHLGLTPLARARLGRDLAATRVDLAQVLAGMAADDDADA